VSLCDKCHKNAQAAKDATVRELNYVESSILLYGSKDSLPLLFEVLSTLNSFDPPIIEGLINLILDILHSHETAYTSGMCCELDEEEA
jgi:hypothetical protein|tara:strand:+ start:448 stop:711 length:264 start_codon:yes stop_codon:yes gene_type:complete